MTSERAQGRVETEVLLRPTQPIYAGEPGSPVYGANTWDFTTLISRESQAERTIRFNSLPAGYRASVRDVLTLMAQPTHPALVSKGVVLRARPAPPSTIFGSFYTLRTFAHWGITCGLACFQDWTQAHADQLLRDLQAGEHRASGTALAPMSVVHYVRELKRVREFAPALPGGGLSFQPWGARSSASVAGLEPSTENTTSPIPWVTWAPLVAASWVVVDRFSDDIIAAADRAARLPGAPRGAGGSNAVRIVEQWIAAGGRVPLQTGFGRASFMERGLLNQRLLARMLGINDSIFKATNNNYRPDVVARLAAMAVDPHRSALGGLYEPTARVRHSDGSETTWISEVGLGEMEYLVSVLRAAAYVILAALTGMRDSEIQAITRDSVVTRDGLPALLSKQYKGRGIERDGQERGWWAPGPVMRTVDVLQRLSPHDSHLLARSNAENVGTYDPSRDIPRLIDFVNGDPASRPGRGHGLALKPIPFDPQTPVHANALRRSYSILAVTHPQAELGLGIQLGHAAWRTTSGYTTDGQQKLAEHLNEDRKNVLRQTASAMLLGTSPIAGRPAAVLREFRAQIVADPTRAERITEQVVERLHLGLLNDCMYNAETAACGPGGPKLGTHLCVGSDCGNAVQTVDHVTTLTASIARHDHFLDQDRGSDALRAQMGKARANLAVQLRTLTNSSEESA